MATYPHPPWRAARVKRFAAQLEIAFRPRSPLLQAAVALVLLAAWALGGFNAYHDISVHPGRRAWNTCWLVAWVAGGLWIFPRLCWAAIGREIVLVNASEIVIRREMGVIRRARTFSLVEVENLRYALPRVYARVDASRGWPAPPLPKVGGSVRFRYRGRDVQFGEGVDWSDIALVLEALRERVHVASTGMGDTA